MTTLISNTSVRQVALGINVSRLTSNLPATGALNIFTITGGRLLIASLVGEVTTIIQNQACTVKVTSTPLAGTAVDLAAPSASIANLEVGGRLTLPAVVGSSAVATPAVPASTVAVQNTNPNPVTVVITGGTMTAVVVNGVTVGTGAGTYVVPAGGAISMTYTVVPTWAWTGPALVTGNAGGVVGKQAAWAIGPGSLSYTTSATNTGQIKWDLAYVPLDAGTQVVAA